MAWGGIDAVPAALNLAANWSVGTGAVLNDLVFKIVPTTSTGKIFDCSGATSVNLAITNNVNLPSPLNYTYGFSPTIVSADASGLSLVIPQSALNGALPGCGALTLSATIEASDGTNNLLLAKGNLQITLVPG